MFQNDGKRYLTKCCFLFSQNILFGEEHTERSEVREAINVEIREGSCERRKKKVGGGGLSLELPPAI